MLSNYKELTGLITEINENIDRYSTDDGRKIKKNNDEIAKLVATLTEANNIILKRLRKFNQELIPLYQNESIFLTEEKIEQEKNILKTINGYNTTEILGINNILYELDKATLMDEIVNHINNLLSIFAKATIILTNKDFDYSLSVSEFMTTFLSSKDNKEIFEKEVKETFESVYWKNPDTIKEVILNFRVLINKHQKELNIYKDNYVKEILETKNDYEILPTLKEDIINLDNINNYDLYLTINRFIDEKDNINDYQLESKTISDIKNKLIDEFIYKNYNDEEKADFYTNLKCLYDSINEFEFIKSFELIIKEIIGIYDKKDELKDELKTKNETIDKLHKDKAKSDKKLHDLLNKLKKNNDSINKKSLFNKPLSQTKLDELHNKITIAEKEVDVKIDEIKAEYSNIVDIEFNHLVITSLNETSTIYDALNLYLKSLVKLKLSIIKNYPDEKLDDKIKDFTNFLYNPYNVIITTLKLKDSLEFNKLIEEKYRLYNINCEITDTNKDLKKNIIILLKDYYLNKCSISREDIKLICLINKIKDSE